MTDKTKLFAATLNEEKTAQECDATKAALLIGSLIQKVCFIVESNITNQASVEPNEKDFAAIIP